MLTSNVPFSAVRHYVAPKSATPGSDDTDTAFRLIYHDPAYPGTATYDVDTAVADTLRLIDPNNGTTDFAFATYTNHGLLRDAVNKLDGWNMVLVGATRAHPTINSTTTLLLAQAAATARTASGVNVFFDTSALEPHRL